MRILLPFLILVPSLFADDASKRAKIDELLQAMNAKSMIDQVYSQMEAMTAQMMPQTGMSDFAKAQLAEFQKKSADLMREYMSWDKMVPVFAKIYQDVYTEDEITGLLDFYKSPAGQSFVKKTPLVMQKSGEAMQGPMKEMMTAMQAMAKEWADKQKK